MKVIMHYEAEVALDFLTVLHFNGQGQKLSLNHLLSVIVILLLE